MKVAPRDRWNLRLAHGVDYTERHKAGCRQALLALDKSLLVILRVDTRAIPSVTPEVHAISHEIVERSAEDDGVSGQHPRIVS